MRERRRELRGGEEYREREKIDHRKQTKRSSVKTPLTGGMAVTRAVAAALRVPTAVLPGVRPDGNAAYSLEKTVGRKRLSRTNQPLPHYP